MNLGDSAAREEGYRDVGRRSVLREFGESQDIVGIHGKKDGLELTTEGFDGRTNELEAVFRILQDSVPG